MTLSIIGQDDASQLAISSKVETSISGKHQQASHVPPADLLLGRPRRRVISLIFYIFSSWIHCNIQELTTTNDCYKSNSKKMFCSFSPRRLPPAWWHRNPPLESPGCLRSAADWQADWTHLPCLSASGRSCSWRGWCSSGSLCRGWWAWRVWCWCKA